MSFFGFDTALVPDDDDDDELLLEEGEIDDLNADTFGVDAKQLGRDFDFVASTKKLSLQVPKEAKKVSDSATSAIWANQTFMDSPQAMPELSIPSDRMYSLEEIERGMLKPKTHDAEVVKERRRLRLEKEEANKKFKGLMLQREKEFIAKIQISALATDNPYNEDFYYQVYKALRREPTHADSQFGKGDFLFKDKEKRGKGSNNVIQNLQKKVQMIVEDSKNRKKTEFSLQGALGKTTKVSTRAPRQALAFEKTDRQRVESENSQFQGGPYVRLAGRAAAAAIEAAYDAVLRLEHLRRQEPPSQENPCAEEILEKQRQEWLEYSEQLRSILLPADPKGAAHGLVKFLSYSKGKKVLPRALRFLSGEEVFQILATIVANVKYFEVCRRSVYDMSVHGKSLQKVAQEIDIFLSNLIPPFISLISDLTLASVVDLMSTLLRENSPVDLLMTKVGVAFLTIFLSKGVDAASDGDVAMWKGIFDQFFRSIQGNLIVCFPPTPQRANINMKTIMDESYVWQFFAALGVNSNLDQQHVIVSELRDKIVGNISMSKSFGQSLDISKALISNVNTLLHALGLDASQVAV